VNVDGVQVHYKTYGRGAEGLVFIHGATCDLGFWRLQLPFLDGTRHVVLVDLPGHGKSDKPRVAYTADLFATAANRAMSAAGIERAVLVGHSLGGMVAFQMVRRWPGAALALVSVDGLLPNSTAPELRGARLADGADSFRGTDYSERLGGWIDGMFVAQTPPFLRQEIRTKMLSAPQHVLVGLLESAADRAVWTADRVDLPVLTVFADDWRSLPIGTSDVPYRREREHFLRTFIPHLQYEVWNETGHFLMMEQPDRFNAVLERFLRSNQLLVR
jgi:pimeloyl-ACP methyl ester carboxylesterase